MQNNHKITIAFIGIFLSIVLLCEGFTLNNIYNTRNEIKVLYQNNGYSKELFNDLDNLYRINVAQKQKWINLYGLLQKLMRRRIIGNLEFVKNDNGMMEIISMEESSLTRDFANDLVNINKISQEKGLKFIYIQMPSRNDLSIPKEFIITDTYYNSIRNITDKSGVFCIKGDEILKESTLKLEDFYMKTDIHPTTEGEIVVANKIKNVLQNNGIAINAIISGPNDENYELQTHKLLGNLAKSAGKYYNGVDIFNEYIPLNDSNTKFEIKDLTTNTVIKNGVFSKTVMNGFQDDVKSEPYWPYWVVDYLQYGKYAYNISNLTSDGPNIMFICDSFCYRTISYLSLGCKNITVIDPRFTGGNEGVEDILNKKDYDAIICLHGTQFLPFLKKN